MKTLALIFALILTAALTSPSFAEEMGPGASEYQSEEALSQGEEVVGQEFEREGVIQEERAIELEREDSYSE